MIDPGPVFQTFFRSSRARPLRTALMIFGIALGVAGVVAIDIAKTSVSKSFELSSAALTTRATHQVMGNDFTVPVSVFTLIRTRLGIKKSAPVISGLVRLEQAGGRTMTLMGVDPFSEIHFRSLPQGSLSQENQTHIRQVFVQGSGVVMGRHLARAMGLDTGDALKLSFGQRTKTVKIGALVDLKGDAGSLAALEGVLLADISLARDILETGDQITRIDLALDEPDQADAVRALLGPGQVLVETAPRNQVIRGLSASFETSLTAFSMLVLFMGIFLIYNTVSFSVARRRHLNGVFRALGAGRRDIFKAVLAEVFVYALAGSASGLVLGVFMGKGAVQAVCATVSDMYYTLTVSQTHITATTLVKGAGVGILAAIASSVGPALNAAGTLPVTLIQASTRHSTLMKSAGRLALAGLCILTICTLIFLRPEAGSGLVFTSIFICFTGACLICPQLIILSCKAMVRTAVWSKNFQGQANAALAVMGIRNLGRSLSASSVIIASLMVVISVYIGVDTMTRSFRESITHWVDGNIGGDIHISSRDELNPAIAFDLARKIERMDQIQAVSAYNVHKIFSSRSGETHVFSYVKNLSRNNWPWLAAQAKGNHSNVQDLLDQGWVAVSEIFARQHQLALTPGAPLKVTMETLEGQKTFPVAGVFTDFFMGGGRAVVSRNTMKTYWKKDEITAIQAFLKPEQKTPQTLQQVMTAIQAMSDRPEPLRIRSGAKIKQSVLAVFDKTFLITRALQVLTALVALTGIVNSVMALVLDRSREIAVLRACGAEPFQVRRLILWECTSCGLLSGLFALPLGIYLAWVLVAVVNFKAFGWTYDMHISWATLAQALGFSVAAAAGSGMIPAVRAARLCVATALRTE